MRFLRFDLQEEIGLTPSADWRTGNPLSRAYEYDISNISYSVKVTHPTILRPPPEYPLWSEYSLQREL